MEKECFGIPRKAFFRQLFMVVLSALSVFICGLSLPFPGIMWEYLVNPNDPVHTTNAYVGLFASMTTMGQPVGALMVGKIVDRYGRKMTLTIANGISFSAYFILTFAIKIEIISYLIQIMLARFLIGLSVGFCMSTCMIYASEISHPNIRGLLISINPIGATIGNIVTFTLGYVLRSQFRTVSGIIAVLSSFTFCVQFNLTETPSWLLLTDKEDRAMISYRYLCGYPKKDLILSEKCAMEFDEIKETAVRNRLRMQTNFKFFQEIRNRDVYMPFTILTIFGFLQNFCGLIVFLMFFIQIAKKASIKTLDPYFVGIIVGGCRFAATVIQAPFLDKAGRRPLALVSITGMAISLLTLLIVNLFKLSSSDLVPLMAILMYVISSAIGMFFVPIALSSELYPQRVRGRMVGITLSGSFFNGFLSIQLFSSLYHFVNITIICAFYATFTVITFMFIYFFVPETKGKTLAEIESLYRKK